MPPLRSRFALKSAAIVSAAALFLSACSASGTTGSNAPVGDPVEGGTLTIFDPVQYAAWNPTNSLWSNTQITPNLAERLIWQDSETGEFKPWLAESWEISDDHLAYTFHLKDGITFSNGDPLDAETVALNFDQHGLGDEAKGIPVDPWWAYYEKSEAIDPLTLVVTFSKPNAAQLQVFSNYRAASILAKPFLDLDFQGQGKLENWIGTGPFTVDSVEGTTGVTLKRRDDYDWAPEGSDHAGRAYLEKVVFKVVPEAGTRVGALASGEAQIARNIAPYDEETVTAQGDVIEAFTVQGETNDLTIQLDANAPTQDKDVRLALQAATDRDEINATVLSPSYAIPSSALTKGTPLRGDASDYLAYDLDKAKELLDQAGWTEGSDGIREKDGQKLQLNSWVAPYYQVSQPVLELLQAQWKKAGVDLVINSVAQTEYESLRTERGDKWVFEQGQQSTAEAGVLHASYGAERSNATHTPKADGVLEDLLEAQSLEFDPAKRAELIQQIEDRIFSEGYSIPLYDETQVFGLTPAVQGFKTESTARMWLYDTWLSE